MTLVYPDYKSLPIIDGDKIWNELEEFCHEGTYVKEGKRAALLQWVLDNFPLVLVIYNTEDKYWEYLGISRLDDQIDGEGKTHKNCFMWFSLSDSNCGECCLNEEWDGDFAIEIEGLLTPTDPYIIVVIKKP